MDNRGRVVRGGMGGFLNPPGHPEHDWSVETDLRRRPENRGSMSLSHAVTCEWLDAATRAAARAKLASWVAPSLSAPEVVDWVRSVLGYFKSMYGDPRVPEPERWHCEHLRTVYPDGGDMEKVMRLDTADGHPVIFFEHAGVHFVRNYFPEYVPSAEDFAGAYWGTKPEPAAV